MTKFRARSLLAGLIATVGAMAGVAALSSAQAAPSAPAAAADMPAAVEDFAYPGAAKIAEERKIVLKKGDGHILLSDCANSWDIKVKSRTDSAGVCFNVTGKKGYVTLELPDSFGIWTTDQPVQATLTADQEKTVINAPKDDYTPMGETGDTGKRSMLVELRITG
ncbi:hypothetical protein ACQPZG_00055 (plasmid) [Streptomyces sp. CA-294286]|uniref:hypothetical protein n=1 Tax=Streptomyces sp. CA-294286 TaxID=3240070 RepID=UPI003D94A09B